MLKPNHCVEDEGAVLDYCNRIAIDYFFDRRKTIADLVRLQFSELSSDFLVSDWHLEAVTIALNAASLYKNSSTVLTDLTDDEADRLHLRRRSVEAHR